jgi:hypothetical protein
MRRLVSAVAVVAAAAAMELAFASAAPAIGAPSSALAAPPEDKFFTEMIDDEFPSALFTETCGFDTWYTLQGTITFRSTTTISRSFAGAR